MHTYYVHDMCLSLEKVVVEKREGEKVLIAEHRHPNLITMARKGEVPRYEFTEYSEN